MYASNQQTLAESRASKRPPMLEKGSYVPWASHFMRFLDNIHEEGERMRHSIEVGPYEWKMIQNPDRPDDPTAKIIEPLSKITESNKKQYFADIREMIRRLMHGSEKTKQQRHSRLVDEIDKFVVVEGESLSSAYERLTTLVNVIDRNEIHPLPITINTKQYEPHVNASRAKKAARNHDPFSLAAHSNVYPSHSHASPSYSHLPQPYYVTYPSSVVYYEEDYQWEIQRDAQEDKLTTAMMLLARAITQRYSTPTTNHLLRDAKYFKEQMLDYHYGDNSLKELIAAIIMMACIQPTENKANVEPTYDVDALGEVNASHIHLKIQMHSKSIHEHTNHAKLKTVINTSDDDQIDSSIIFDDPYVDNNGGTDEHDSNAHDQSVTLESLIQNVQKEAKNQRSLNNELKKQNVLLQKELETCYQNPERLKKSIKAQHIMYDGERLQSTKLIIDSPNSEETLEDAKESQLKMKDKMIQLNYEKLNALYETFVPQTEISIDQTYLSTLSTSNV
ncbi:hypothetical protein Tco_1287476, partial [Tanacetum coccineum]